MPRLKPPGSPRKILSRRAIGELGALEANLQELGTHRSVALRLFLASRNATTQLTQHEFWLEFSWIDQEYRAAVRRLAEFCQDHRGNTDRR
ncbi:MAG: hypothetical protein ACLPTM_12390 [Steroidobacteraceae bacterium]